MKIKEAVQILEDHNKWRQDDTIPSTYEYSSPRKITEAINTIVSYFKENIIK